MSESSGHEYLRSHQIAGDVLALNIEAEVASVLETARQANQGTAAKTLVKDGPLRVVILGFKSGSALEEHRTAGPLSIQVLSGNVQITAQDRSETLAAGGLLVFGAAVPHSVRATADAVLLLTIAWPTSE